MLKNFFSFVFELIKIVVISLVIIIPIRYFLIQPFYVKGASMEPNFHDHEYLIIDEISYRFKDPGRGDIIVFRYPVNPQEYFIKRIVALPGEKVQIKDGQVLIYNDVSLDGKVLDESYLSDGIKTYSLSDKIVNLGEDEYFVLGDNRGHSFDSRNWGALDGEEIIGRAVLRAWPFNGFGFIQEPNY